MNENEEVGKADPDAHRSLVEGRSPSDGLEPLEATRGVVDMITNGLYRFATEHQERLRDEVRMQRLLKAARAEVDPMCPDAHDLKSASETVRSPASPRTRAMKA